MFLPPTTTISKDEIIPGPDKATVFMIRSLEQMQSTLICPLCQQMLTDPSTLACAHTFCWKCIEAFSCNNSLCPVPGCGIPLSMTGSRQGSFLKTNPSLETVLSSFHTICQALEKAPPKWWQNNNGEDHDTRNDNNINNSNEPINEVDQNSNSHDNTDGEPSNHDDDNDHQMETKTKTNGVMFDIMDMDDDDSTSSDETVNFNSTRKSQDETNDRNDAEFGVDVKNWAKQINIDSSDDENNHNGDEDETN